MVLVGGVMLMTASVGDAGNSQKEFEKSGRYDATQCVTVEEEPMIAKKKTKKSKKRRSGVPSFFRMGLSFFSFK